ncbi:MULTISPECIES: ABC transporter substrate-binding protein [unclassified Marinitoga]|uniref:ABC transporter substrate-binding protein n=1 Tax=unclassified Marinitoga TaxID=2640159 RepID=UPI000640D67D|nr:MULTISPECIES: ABC transporter substrate-binding protein [unclassified Marinitoga]KLO23166.1 ABC transporter substrate-binding protein [Marinitoga sp. 1155]NUU99950.1 ABC transporter substrate-binding protein [Marinitoga sp. 1154]
MKKFFVVWVLLLSLVSFSITVGITQIIDHPALNQVQKAIIKTIKEENPNVEIIIQNAQGSFQNAVSIAQEFNNTADIIVAITTPSAQAAANVIKDKPLIFSAVTDPISAGLIKNFGKNNGNIVGLSDLLPVHIHLSILKKLIPNAKNIGIIFNPGETNSKTLLNLSKKFAKDLKLNIVEIPGTTSSEMINSLNSKINDIDAVYIFTDNLLASSIESIGKILNENKIPSISGDIELAKAAKSIVGFGFDYYSLGKETGKMVNLIIKGSKPSDLESKTMDMNALILFINLKSANNLNIDIPDSLLEKADEVVR